MKRITPNKNYRELPCSAVALGCALGVQAPSDALCSSELRSDGYLSLAAFNRLIRANIRVIRHINFKRGGAPLLRDWARESKSWRTIVCVKGHYVYFDSRDYHSFLWNGGDPVISVWYLD